MTETIATFSPLYQQIKALILGSLQAGEWKPGEAIPSENDLATRFKVSQGTVRKAIDELANENLLVRRQGKGTFVATEGVPSNSMKVVTEASKVYLMGIVTDAEANRAVEIARGVPGVKQVTKVFDLISEADKKRLDGAK